jgi:hypothetical protein
MLLAPLLYLSLVFPVSFVAKMLKNLNQQGHIHRGLPATDKAQLLKASVDQRIKTAKSLVASPAKWERE